MIYDATFFAFVAFAIFIALMIALKIPQMIAAQLDARSQAIAKELQDARRLREEAERLLADYKLKHAAAEAEAQAIVASAKEQAAALAQETRESIQAGIARRQRQAEERIAQAEAKASSEVRAAAIEAAMAAAEKMLRDKIDVQMQAALVAEGAADMKRKFG